MPRTQAEQYAEDAYSALRLYATWPPGLKMELGSYGVLRGRWFNLIGNISQKFDIQLAPIPGHVPVQLDFKSAGTSLSIVEAAGSATGGQPSGAVK